MRAGAILIMIIVAMLSTGCSGRAVSTVDEGNRQIPESDQSYGVAFEQGNGHITVIPASNTVQFVVQVSGLENHKDYEVYLADSNGGGVTFGAGGTYVHLGTLRSETVFSPVQGQLLLWSVHPIRIIEGLQEPRIIVREKDMNHQEVVRSMPLTYKQ